MLSEAICVVAGHRDGQASTSGYSYVCNVQEFIGVLEYIYQRLHFCYLYIQFTMHEVRVTLEGSCTVNL